LEEAVTKNNPGSDQPARPRIEIVAHGGVQPVEYDDGASLSPATEAFTQLDPPMSCALCLEGVADVEKHVERDHTPEGLASYQAPEDPKKWSPRVNEREATAHPGGREGAPRSAR
jgi:hypothetical protein